jgi:hypothetical protein
MHDVVLLFVFVLPFRGQMIADVCSWLLFSSFFANEENPAVVSPANLQFDRASPNLSSPPTHACRFGFASVCNNYLHLCVFCSADAPVSAFSALEGEPAFVSFRH